MIEFARLRASWRRTARGQDLAPQYLQTWLVGRIPSGGHAFDNLFFLGPDTGREVTEALKKRR